jgi:acetolactate synthase-1/2/3 large subunit
LLIIADGYDDDLDYVTHQRIDQHALLAPVVKASCNLDGDDPIARVAELLDLALAWPPGPVYLEITGKAIRRPAPPGPTPSRAVHRPLEIEPEGALADAVAMLASAKRPVIIAGLEAREPAATAKLRELVAAWDCPVFTTYRAKGVADDSDAHTLGHYIGGVAEYDALREADLIVLFGLDPIEFLPHKWQYDVPVLELGVSRFERHIVASTLTVVGELRVLADALVGARGPSDWPLEHLASLKKTIRERASANAGGPITPEAVVEAAQRVFSGHATVAVDAGAHTLTVLHLWATSSPEQLVVSRGLATMAFALPAAIGLALADPERQIVAFTGDGGLMMCAGELATAVQYGCKIVVVVFNDAKLALIAAKQQRRGLAADGVDFCASNLARVAEGFGCASFRVERLEELEAALRLAAACDGPAVVDVVVDPVSYYDEVIALRG